MNIGGIHTFSTKYIHQPEHLQEFVLRSRSDTNDHECRKRTEDTKKPRQPMSILARDRNIHSPQARNQVTWHEDRSQESNLTQTRVDSQTQSEIGSAHLG